MTCQTSRWRRRCARIAVGALTAASALGAAESPASLPEGLVDFAGRLAHNHWQVIGPEVREELDALNRALRESAHQIRQAPDEVSRRAAARRASADADRLLDIVRQAPRLLRVDLTTQPPTLSSPGPVELPGDTGALLFEVTSGAEGLRCSTSATDFSQPGGESSRVPVEVASQGLTYALVGLDQVPIGRTMLAVEFRRAGLAAIQLPLEVRTPAPGRLRLTVLSDDTGKPSPAMVRLMWRTDGLQRRPANGIEFAYQFDAQGLATGARAANLPGGAGTHFWCVPGPFDMALAPGVWQIGVRRGVEHEVVFEDVTLRSGETIEKVFRPRRWVDQRRQGWWSGDDHVHCRLMSDDDARRLLAWVQAEDVHLANVVRMGDIYRTYFEQRGFGPDHRVIDGETALVPGQECPRTHDQIGHTLAMNITAMVRDPEHYFLYDTVFDAVHAQGGLTGYAHVNSGLFHVHRDMSLNVPREKVDFVEILQFNQLGTDLYYEFLNLGCKLTASAGSDVPWGGTVGEVRAYAYLGAEPFSADRWFAAFGRGRTFTTSGPMLEFSVDDALPGDQLNCNTNRVLKVRARAWGDPQRMAPVTLDIVRHGDVLATSTSTDPRQTEARLELAVESAHGFWIAARARAGDGTSAHTTPVYVVREGFRFWKHDAVTDLLAKRRESLHQIRTLIAEAEESEAQNRLGNDRYRKELARQGPALRERIDRAEGIYDGLQRTAESERAARGARP